MGFCVSADTHTAVKTDFQSHIAVDTTTWPTPERN